MSDSTLPPHSAEELVNMDATDSSTVGQIPTAEAAAELSADPEDDAEDAAHDVEEDGGR